MVPSDLIVEAGELLERLAERGLTLATAESCTGGLIVAALTEVPGSSRVVDRGFITYSNTSKTVLLGVPAELIAAHGAVSAEVACAMAAGALDRSTASLAVSVTGVAGPGGASPDKPVGTVHIALAVRGGPVVHRLEQFPAGPRSAIRRAAVRAAFALLRAQINADEGSGARPQV